MLFFLLYVAFLLVWFWATRRLRADGTRPDLTVTARRLRGWWTERIVGFGSAQAPASRDTFTPSGSHAQWTCEIAWQPGQMRFQAVISPNSAPKAHVVGDAKSLRWPKRVHKPSTRELESAMGSLAASIAAAGWEPVQPRGPWSERRFVWRQEGEQPTGFDLVGGEPIAATEPADRAAGPAHSPDPSPPRAGPERAPRGANRDAVLRTMAEHTCLTMAELAVASGVKRSSLPPLLRTLTVRGEVEKITRPDGKTAYALTQTAAQRGEAPLEPAGGGERPR